MVKTFTRLEEDGSYTITNCCAVAGLGGDSKRYRDGSFEYYISEPIIENDPKSVGSFILAAIEYEKMTKKNKLKTIKYNEKIQDYSPFVAAIDNGNFGCSTEENTKTYIPWDNGKLVVSEEGRYLKHENGAPFFWLEKPVGYCPNA